MAESRLVPSNLLAWPRTRDLLPDQKLLICQLWITADSDAGCWMLDIAGLSASTSITAPAVTEAVAEFERLGLVDIDHGTGEVFLQDWFRWHRFSGKRVKMLKVATKKIQSERLRAVVEAKIITISEKTTAYLPNERKGKEINTTTTKPPRCAAGGGINIMDKEDLLAMLGEQAARLGKNCTTWPRGAIRRMEREGVDEGTAEQLKNWQQARERGASSAKNEKNSDVDRRDGYPGLDRLLAAAGAGLPSGKTRTTLLPSGASNASV